MESEEILDFEALDNKYAKSAVKQNKKDAVVNLRGYFGGNGNQPYGLPPNVFQTSSVINERDSAYGNLYKERSRVGSRNSQFNTAAAP